ncbi:MAG TPA: hypothetical protein VM164_05675 [Burkholderiales bacterium]|nr:hypothetical protein [Burkholderiales bacterium]
MMIRSVVLALALAVASAGVLAQTTSTPRIDQRQENQQKRIDKGVQSGALNEKEARRLEKGQQRVQKAENKAMADGTVTAKEKRKIEHMQDNQSKKIYREKHDKQVRK